MDIESIGFQFLSFCEKGFESNVIILIFINVLVIE